jgi:hypothetical protein
MDLLAINITNFHMPDSVVLAAIGLGVLVAMGLVIREKAQGAENMKLIQAHRAEMLERHDLRGIAAPSVSEHS